MKSKSRTFRLTIGYDGTSYAGWQIQRNKPTIQGHLEAAFAKLIGERVPIIGSGRTDAGVHALAQVASLTTDRWRDPADAIARAINTKLPDDISVYLAEEMPLGFHALRDATGKMYRYQMQVRGVRDAFAHRYTWTLFYRLDIDRMQEAASRIVGKHDFACFQAAGSERPTTVRTVRRLDILQQASATGGERLAIEIEADGFLYNMVRNIVGSLVEVGRGKFPVSWIDELIQSRDRKLAGQTAPAQGLFLARVDYDVQPLAD